MAADPCPCPTSMPTPRGRNLVVQGLSRMTLGAVVQEANATSIAPTINGQSQSPLFCKKYVKAIPSVWWNKDIIMDKWLVTRVDNMLLKDKISGREKV